MSIETSLASFTRKIPSFKGKARLIRPLRHYFYKRYKGREDKWVTISDYDRDIKMKLDRSSYMGGSIYWLGKHHWREVNFLKKNLKPDMVMIDVGANQGEFSLLAAKYLTNGKVMAFEPQSDMCNLLNENIEVNGFKNVNVFNFGLSDHDSVEKLYTSTEESIHSGIHEGLYTSFPDDTRSEYVQEFRITQLDKVLNDEPLRSVDFMKIDVEGGELMVLKGAYKTLKQYKPKIIIEINAQTFKSAGYDTKDLLEYLAQFGYQAYRFLYSGEVKKIEPKMMNEAEMCVNVLFM